MSAVNSFRSVSRLSALLLTGLLAIACVSSDAGEGDLALGEASDVASAAAPPSRQAAGVSPSSRQATGAPPAPSRKKDVNLRRVADLPAPRPAEDGSTIMIAENDVLEVDIFQVNELDRVVQVDSRGMIAMPLIGEVPATGRSPQGLANEVARLYGAKYLQSPQVTVFMKESNGRLVTIDGEVGRAGKYPTTSSSTLMGVLTEAGGLNQIADKSKIFVFRDFDGEKLVANYNLNKIRKGIAHDPQIYGGDIVVVFPSGARVASKNLKEVLGLTRSVTPFVP